MGQPPENLSREAADNIRKNRYCDIVICIAQDVPPYLSLAAQQGVLDALKASRQFRRRVTVMQAEFVVSPWFTVEHFLRQTELEKPGRENGFGKQLDASVTLQLLRDDPSQQKRPCWKVLVAQRDLYTSEHANNNFVFGLTETRLPASIQSITRIQHGNIPQRAQEMVTRRLLRHEVGHMFGLVSRTQFAEDKQLGTHCASPVCSMQQGMTLYAWMEQAEAEEKAKSYFCEHCLRELEATRARFDRQP